MRVAVVLSIIALAGVVHASSSECTTTFFGKKCYANVMSFETSVEGCRTRCEGDGARCCSYFSSGGGYVCYRSPASYTQSQAGSAGWMCAITGGGSGGGGGGGGGPSTGNPNPGGEAQLKNDAAASSAGADVESDGAVDTVDMALAVTAGVLAVILLALAFALYRAKKQ
eukprot:PLAT3681.8.p1 GENE.PLAT3681.8~~PLAT3681.8.p1  ORF type:complete len:169 (-),score=40.04 PLAT3681.8:197-703(-)